MNIGRENLRPVAEGNATSEKESPGHIPNVTILSLSKTILCASVRARKTELHVDGRVKFLKRALIFSPAITLKLFDRGMAKSVMPKHRGTVGGRESLNT